MPQETPLQQLSHSHTHKNNIHFGASCFIEGAKLMWHPKLRLYSLVPLLANCILFFVITAAFISKYRVVIDAALEFIPAWLAPIAWIAFVVLGVLLLVVYGYSFNLITNIIAAPFYGRLAEKTEALITGNDVAEEPLAKMIPRVVYREIIKLWYFLSRGLIVMLVIILIGTIPLINLLAPLLGLAWSAWSMSIQYADYPADNNRLGFKALRNKLWDNLYSSLGFGSIVMLISFIPVLNIFAMPAAVTGGTVYWVKSLQRSSPP